MIDTKGIASIKTMKKVGSREGETRKGDSGLAMGRGADGKVSVEKMRDIVSYHVVRPAGN